MAPRTEPLAIRFPTVRSVRFAPPEPKRAVIARCTVPACGAVTELEVNADRRLSLESASLSRLEDQLRCTCGARTGQLEFGSTKGPTPSGRGRLYLFLI